MSKWHSCELEALAFANAVNTEYDILKECRKPVILSPDSKPVADAVKMIKKGLYSSNPRIQTFITNVNRVPLVVQLASGKNKHNLPSDYHSRHPSECVAQHCSVCSFVKESAASVNLPSINAVNPVNNMSNQKAWNAIQDQEKATKQAKYLISTGKTASKVTGKINSEIRQLCRNAKVRKNDNLLYVPAKPNKYSAAETHLVVIPSTHLPALLWQIHNTLNHPTKSQLQATFNKTFYSVGLTPTLEKLYQECFFAVHKRRYPQPLIIRL